MPVRGRPRDDFCNHGVRMFLDQILLGKLFFLHIAKNPSRPKLLACNMKTRRSAYFSLEIGGEAYLSTRPCVTVTAAQQLYLPSAPRPPRETMLAVCRDA